ncbi:MAG: Gfo/Idh/MocA family oxidoreductase, partial [Propionibacteriales bacterium]|nr:Gfo/Idh/MocA family oxidoreductase [Propionibacteriales bacterium]
MTLRLGLVGGGWISQQHLEALEQIGRTELVGVVSGSPATGDAVTARWGGARYDDVDALVDEAGPDLVYV